MPVSSAATLMTNTGASGSPRSKEMWVVLRVGRSAIVARSSPGARDQLRTRVVVREGVAVGLEGRPRGTVEGRRELHVDRDEQVGPGPVTPRRALALDPERPPVGRARRDLQLHGRAVDRGDADVRA